MTKAEQETVLRWAADEDVISVFTAHAPTKRKLERAGLRSLPHEHRGRRVGRELLPGAGRRATLAGRGQEAGRQARD